MRPADLYVIPAPRTKWDAYAPQHYLDTQIHRCSRVYLAHRGLEEVGCIVLLHQWGNTAYWRISRVAVQEQWQGQGVGGALVDWAGAELTQVYKARRISIVTALWPIIHHCNRSLLWHRVRRHIHGNAPHSADRTRPPQHVTSRGRQVLSYVYVA